MRPLVSLIAIAGSGCHLAALPIAPQQVAGESASPVIVQEEAPPAPQPLVLHCECPETDQPRLMRELTAERAAIAERLGLPESDAPLHIHLFADHAAYRRHVAASYPDFPARRAIFVETGEELSVYAHCGDHLAEDLRHEAAHGFLHASAPNLPLWLDEGLAEFFEVGRGAVGLNRPHVETLRSQLAVNGWRPDLERLEQLHDGGAMTQLEYAESWLWVHFLLESPGDKSDVLTAYLADLKSGSAGPGAPGLSARLARRLSQPEAALLEHLETLLP